MSKKKGKAVVNGEEIEVFEEASQGEVGGYVDEQLEVVQDGEEGELDEKEAEEEAGETLGDTEGIEGLGKIRPEAWKEARSILREADAACGYSIDEFNRRKEINTLKKRFNNKERSAELYMAIIALGG